MAYLAEALIPPYSEAHSSGVISCDLQARSAFQRRLQLPYRHRLKKASNFTRTFALCVNERPILAFAATGWREARELCEEHWLREDLQALRSEGIPLCDAESVLLSGRRRLKRMPPKRRAPQLPKRTNYPWCIL